MFCYIQYIYLKVEHKFMDTEDENEKVTWANLEKDSLQYDVYEFPKVSIIIPSYNNALALALTAESVLTQDYPDFEVILIDAGSTDHSLEVVRNYHDDRIRTYSVTGSNPYEMLNRGLSLAHGTYVNFLFPGDFYLQRLTLKHVMSLALDHGNPPLVYGVSTERFSRDHPRAIFHPLNLRNLQKGVQPTSLQACWFRNDLFQQIGNFSTRWRMKGGFDLFCRFCLNRKLRAVSVNRVVVDYDLRTFTNRKVLRQFWETLQIIAKYFGVGATIGWWFAQKHFSRVLRLCFRQLRLAFFGK